MTRTKYVLEVHNLSSRISWQDLKDLFRKVVNKMKIFEHFACIVIFACLFFFFNDILILFKFGTGKLERFALQRLIQRGGILEELNFRQGKICDT